MDTLLLSISTIAWYKILKYIIVNIFSYIPKVKYMYQFEAAVEMDKSITTLHWSLQYLYSIHCGLQMYIVKLFEI